MGDIGCSLCLLVKLKSRLDGFLSCAGVGQTAKRFGGSLCGFGHLFLCICLGNLKDSQRVADVNVVAFFHTKLYDTSGKLAAYTKFGNLYFSLNHLFCLSKGEETDESDDDYCHSQSGYSQENVMMLRFC